MYIFQQRTSHLLFIELEFYVNLDVRCYFKRNITISQQSLVYQ